MTWSARVMTHHGEEQLQLPGLGTKKNPPDFSRGSSHRVAPGVTVSARPDTDERESTGTNVPLQPLPLFGVISPLPFEACTADQRHQRSRPEFDTAGFPAGHDPTSESADKAGLRQGQWSDPTNMDVNRARIPRSWHERQRASGEIILPDESLSADTIARRKVTHMQIPEEINREAWERWTTYRRQDKRKPVTARAASMQFKTLSALTHEQQAACIDHSIRNDYQGLFPERVKPAGRTGHRTILEDLTDRSWAE